MEKRLKRVILYNNPEFLSAKTTKKTGKIAPQVIGQANPKNLCMYLSIEYSSNDNLKAYIYSNYVQLLQLMEYFTFYNKKIVYYNKHTDILQTILKKQDIYWNDFKYTWTRSSLQDWENSNTLKIKYKDKDISLCEVQFHSRSRKNVVLRWYFDNLLEIMCSNLEILKF
jgi:hydroxymethylpyrimidine pyrophosphatase-like HAD family hydrolase